MRASAQNTGLLLLLGLGGADLVALNFWVLPALLVPAVTVAHRQEGQQTAWLAATERARLPPAASEPEPAFAAAEASAQPVGVEPAAPVAAVRLVQPVAALEPVEPVAAETAVPAARLRAAQDGAVIRFMRGTWWVGPEDRAQLAQLAATLAPGAAIEIDGYADASGPDPLNQRISQQRAEAIAEQLVRVGVDRARLRVRAHGELPASARDDGEHDRRAELRVVRGQP